MGESLAGYLITRLSVYIDEMILFLYDEFGLYVSDDTVQRWLRQNKSEFVKLVHKIFANKPPSGTQKRSLNLTQKKETFNYAIGFALVKPSGEAVKW